MASVFPPPAPSVIPIAGSGDGFAVHRIYCIGRNYADHAREMGMPVDRERPLFFCKPADAIVVGDADVPYPPATGNFHHEVEMIVALGSGGSEIAVADALGHVHAYGVGLDLTRRDLQAAAKQAGDPWDAAKAFDHSAPVSSLHPVARIGHPTDLLLQLDVNGETRQQGSIGAMLFGVAEIIHELSKLWRLAAGDLIFTGTPAGVAPLQRGDVFHARLGDVAALRGRIV